MCREEDRPEVSRAVTETTLSATSDMPMPLAECIAELAGRLGIEVDR